MELSAFNKNIETKDIPVFKLVALLVSFFVVNYIAKNGDSSSSNLLITFIAFELILILIDPVYAFVFSFVIHVDVMSYFDSGLIQPLAFITMFYVFIKDPNTLKNLLADKKLRNLLSLNLVLMVYLVLINIWSKSGFNYVIFLRAFGYVFGFLAILPAYYFTIKQPKDFFISLIAITGCFLFVYYLDIIKPMGIFKLDSYLHLEDSTMERLAGYDVRQFMIFFAYLIPASVLLTNIKKINQYVLIALGIFSYIIFVLAFYRLAMFYVVAGAILSYTFIKKYADTTNILKYLIAFIALLFFASIFFANYITEISNIFQITIDYFSGKGVDNSADTRFDFQLPFLSKLFFSNPWTGIGLIEIIKFYAIDMMGFVDFPIIGTLTAYGIIGMILYYLKFFVLLTGTNRNSNNFDINKHEPFTLYIYLTLKAYFITMITFRVFYVSWEFTFDYQQAEFGLFAGVFLALNNILGQQELEDQSEEEEFDKEFEEGEVIQA